MTETVRFGAAAMAPLADAQEIGTGGGNREWPSTAFVLSGGGNLGAVHVGMLRALFEAGIRPDAVVGTSIGALNGAFIAGHADLAGVDALAELWISVRRRDVFPVNIPNLLRGFFGRAGFMFSELGLERLLHRASFGYSSLEEAPLPIRVVAADIGTAEVVVLRTGNTIRSLLASSAIPGVFPPVELDGRLLVDGGVLANVPIDVAEGLDPSTIYVLPTLPESLPTRPINATAMIQRAVTLAGQTAARSAKARAESRRAVRVLPVPDTAAYLSAFDFSATGQLIAKAYEMTMDWLEHGVVTENDLKCERPAAIHQAAVA